MHQALHKVETVTVYRGKDMAVYEASDFYENGDNATPIKIWQNPGVNAPFKKIRLRDVDTIIVPTHKKEN